jgi:hypothetical protein
MRTQNLLLLFVMCLGCGDTTSGVSSSASGSSSTGDPTTTSSASSSTGNGGAGGMGASGSTSSGAAGMGGTGGMGTGGMGGGGLPACPTYAKGVSGGNIQNGSLTEASGIVESRKAPGVLWIHNDSGDSARVFAAGKDGKDLGTYSFQGASATDWEDIAIGPGPMQGESYLYMGDIGDNAMARANIRIYRVVEPLVDLNGGPKNVTLTGVETFTLVYPDSPHNAETLLVDPKTGDVYIVTKSSNGVSPIFRAAAPLSNAGTIIMEAAGSRTFGAPPLPGGPLTTGGDISAQGDLIAIRTYPGAFVWRRPSGMSIADALQGEPCVIPIESEPQGEALGFAVDGSGYFTISEGSNEPLYFYAKQ